MSVPSRVALLALLGFAVVAAPLAAGGGVVPPAVGTASADQTTETPSPPMPAETTAISIRIDADGDAQWTITTRLDVQDEQDREAFETLVSRYESGQSTPPWVGRVRVAAAAASDASGRQMNVSDVRTTSDVNNSTVGVHFTWSNFARDEGDNMVVDDAFNTTQGTWLDGLTESQELTIELPDGYGAVDAPKAVQDGRLHWQGPQQFEPGYMEIVYSGDAGPPGTVNPGGANDLLWGGFFVVGLGIVVVGAYVFSRRRDGLPSLGPDDGEDPSSARMPGAGPDDEPDAQTATAGTVEPAADATDDEVDDDETGGNDDVDEELLSDEERVERLLESNGGRMKQANIVKETGWSNAKVSQLLSAMADEGEIDKLRIGRENLISFPDEDVTDLDQD